LEGYYGFLLVITEQKNKQLLQGEYQKLSNRLPLDKLELIFTRITDPNTDLSTIEANSRSTIMNFS
jgi:inner membrane protein